MAKARSRTAARKVKDKWKAKKWYNILAPTAFDSVTVADSLTENPDKLINRVTAVSLQDLTNDFRKSHIKLFFKVHKVEDNNALTQYEGHTLTSDYLRRMIRRRRSKIDGVYDVRTRDGAKIRVKPFATTDKRVQNSQKRVIREAMRDTIANEAKTSTLSEFVKEIIDGKTGSEIYKKCKKLYPVKRVEIYKTEVIEQPSIKIEDEKPKKKEEKEVEEKETKEKPKKKKDDKEYKKEEDVKETSSEEVKEEPKKETEEPKEDKEEKPAEEPKKEDKPKKATKAKKTPAKKKTTTKKPAAKKTTTKTAKKTETKKKATAKKTTAKKTTSKKTPTKKSDKEK